MMWPAAKAGTRSALDCAVELLRKHGVDVEDDLLAEFNDLARLYDVWWS